MGLFCEKKDAQDKLIRLLQELKWEFIPQLDLNEDYRSFNFKEPFLLGILREKLKELNPGVIGGENADEVIRKLRIIQDTISGNHEFLNYLRGKGSVYVPHEKRERNFKLIDFENIDKNHFAFTTEFIFDGKERKRLDLVLFINGIPIACAELKNPAKENWESEAFEQVKNYNKLLPELFKYLQFYVVSDGIKLFYGPTWDYQSKTLYQWQKGDNSSNESLFDSFFKREEILDTIRAFTVFTVVDNEHHKYILKYHQRRAIRKIIERVLKGERRRGLIWHTQGAYKSLTMLVAAEELRKLPELENPTILIVVDRVELEGQMNDNLKACNFENYYRASSKEELRELLKNGTKGLILSTIQKFEGMPENVNTSENIIVLVDEAHRSQEGDLGNYMRGALPNAFFFGFTGTPVVRSGLGKGTFVTFGYEDEPYLDKYSIDDSIKEGTTIPLYYQLVKQELWVDKETLEEEFFKVVREEGATSIEKVNQIIEKAQKLKSILKAPDRVEKIARHIADHFRKYVEPLGFKAFVVAVDREGCAMYKEALDQYLPPEYSKVVFTPMANDGDILRKYHIDDKQEIQIRKDFKSANKLPKILIVTEKLLTGYDAPILYTMYLDKPLSDHALLQAIARVNRPYEGKTVGLILDYIGIFDELQKALSFDSKDLGAALVDFEKLKEQFKKLMLEADVFLKEIDLESPSRAQKIVEQFFDEEKRKCFIELFKKIQNLYEILSPDQFLRGYMDKYSALVGIYRVLLNNFIAPSGEREVKLRELGKKTEDLIRKHVKLVEIVDELPIYRIDKNIANVVKADKISEKVKVINLYRSLMRHISTEKERSPYLVSLAEKVEEIMNLFKEQQISVEKALESFLKLSEEAAEFEEEQTKSGLSKDEFSYFWILKQNKVHNAEQLAKKICKTINEHEFWFDNPEIEKDLRIELYKILMGSLEQSVLAESHTPYPDTLANTLPELVDKILKVGKAIKGYENL